MTKIISAVVSVFVLIVSAISVFLFSGTKSVLTGYSLKCGNGSYMIIEEDGSPIRYSFNNAKGTDTEKLTDGDRILIISDGIEETYPASTAAHFIFKYAEGSAEDIPEETLSRLAELGWYKLTE